MREIEFRGKEINNGKWVYGYYHKLNESFENKECILEHHRNTSTIIDVRTLGQYTGLTDKNGTKIFEGDIVRINGWWDASGPAGYEKNMTVVKYDDEVCGFTPMCNYDTDCGVFHRAEECEVIGNVFDNPELLEKVEE